MTISQIELQNKSKGLKTMLSVEACRKILGKTKEEMTDQEIKEIQELLYQMAKVLVKNYKGVVSCQKL